MLDYWRTQKEYVSFVLAEFKKLVETSPESIVEYNENISTIVSHHIKRLVQHNKHKN